MRARRWRQYKLVCQAMRNPIQTKREHLEFPLAKITFNFHAFSWLISNSWSLQNQMKQAKKRYLDQWTLHSFPLSQHFLVLDQEFWLWNEGLGASGVSMEQILINMEKNIPLNHKLALWVRKGFDCLELNDTECSRVRIRGKATRQRSWWESNQGEEAGETFYEQLGKVPQSLIIFLVGDFSLPDVCWKHNTVERKHSGRLLECVEYNTLTRMVRESPREGTCWTCCLHQRRNSEWRDGW